MLKAFYGRYYNNIADSFTGDQSRRHQPSRNTTSSTRTATGVTTGRPNWARCACVRRRRQHAGRSRLQDPVHRGDQRVVRDPAARRVVGAASTYVRKNHNDFASFYVTQPGHGVGRQRKRCRSRSGPSAPPARRSTCVDVPDAIADQTNGRTPTSPTATSTTTRSKCAYHEAGEPEVLHPDQRRLPVAQRLPVGVEQRAGATSRARCQRRSDRHRLLLHAEPGGRRTVRRRRRGTSSSWAATRSRGRSASPPTGAYQSGFPFSPIVADGDPLV